MVIVLSEKLIPYGGQAVVEGVMFSGKYIQVTAVRRKDGTIETYQLEKKAYPVLEFLKKIPIVRGLIALIESSALGAKHMQFASEKYELDQGEGETEQVEGKNSSEWTMWLGVAIVGIISLVIGKVMFTALPAFLASFLFDPYIQNLIVQNLLEGAIKTILLLLYLWGISQTPMIKRVFQYHGAEHKVISTYENREPLSIQNVQKYSTLHYRCGSSFLVFSVIVGVIVYSLFPYENVWDRIWTRLLLLPLVIGLSYEVLRFTNSLREVPILRYLGYPGLWLQKLTTREPKDDQVEVAIVAFERMRELEEAYVEDKSRKEAFVS